MLGQETKSYKQMGLAPSHGLLEMEDSLRRRTSQAGYALGDEVLHAIGDVSLGEEGRALTLGGNQAVKLLYLVAQGDREGIILENAGVSDGFHCFDPSNF